MSIGVPEPKPINGNPAIGRAMELLGELERSPNGLSLDELTRRTSISRSSVYRILKSFEAHGVVRALLGGTYVLGSRILQLAASISSAAMDHDLPRLSQSHLEHAARETGETTKVSIHDRGAVLVVLGAPGSSDHALHTVTGRYQPLHAGAGSKILMSHLAEEEFLRLTTSKLKRFTGLTLVTEADLRAERERILVENWSFDPGEYSPNINAYGAPIFEPGGTLVGAVSIPFGSPRSQAHHDLVRDVAIATAQAISEDIG